MLSKVKEFFTGFIGTTVLVLTTAVGILLWMLNSRRKEVNALKAQIDLAKTQREVDLIEVQIKERLANVDSLSEEVKELNKALSDIEDRRSKISAQEKSKSSDDVENFWRNS